MSDVEVRSGAQPGDVMTLRGQGVTHLRGTGRGDLLVHLDVQTPTHLDPEQQDLLRQLATVRGEERPEARLAPVQSGLFGKLRGAFTGK
jgi:molecular chaperone DnaJ